MKRDIPGTRCRSAGTASTRRFIPTCVGNTQKSPLCAIRAPVHPHVRGEHGRRAAWAPRSAGSSPRAWGTHSQGQEPNWVPRFIPTCVGNTPVAACRIPRSAVHPHVRGEHSCVRRTTATPAGSSPRAWGTRPRRPRRHGMRRFIPTCVGNTEEGRCSPRQRSVHPHVRGEHFFHLRDRGFLAGSSPRAWGTPDGG